MKHDNERQMSVRGRLAISDKIDLYKVINGLPECLERKTTVKIDYTF